MTYQYILLFYIALINIIGFSSMGLDKRKARRHLYRIPEKNLFAFALLGGSIGSIIGMYFFHHKTKHSKFVFGMPAILLLQILIIYLIKNFVLYRFLH